MSLTNFFQASLAFSCKASLSSRPTLGADLEFALDFLTNIRHSSGTKTLAYLSGADVKKLFTAVSYAFSGAPLLGSLLGSMLKNFLFP